jgi:hypothetical protein
VQETRVLKGRRTCITRLALLPEREILAPAVPAVPPQANIYRASSAEDASSHISKLPLRNLSYLTLINLSIGPIFSVSDFIQ